MPDSFGTIDKEAIGMLRNAHAKQVQLTILADQKANMLMGIILVALSVIVSNMAVNDLNNMIAKVSFAVFCLVETISVMLSLLVVMPRLGPKIETETLDKTHNPLYFMHFLNVDKNTFNEIMLRNMENPELVYTLILNDFYDMGLGLKKKYLMLQRAYLTAAIGLIPASVILFSSAI